MGNKYHQLFFLALIIVFSSCAKQLDEAYTPSYIKIDQIEMQTTGSQGSSSSYLTDAWVYIDGAERGAYPLPSTIPLLAEGEHKIKVAPGIKLNGVAGTRVPYPMIEPVEMQLTLVKDSVKQLNIQCNYYSTTAFAMIEDFEDINFKFETTEYNTAVWRPTHSSTDPADYIFEGYHSGGGFLNDEKSDFQIVTKQIFDELPKQGIPVFIEMDFNLNTTVVLSMSGLEGQAATKDIIYLAPTDGEWKKIYINLTSTISYDVQGDRYRFFLSANHTNGDEESVVLIDNFKILYRDIQ